MTTDNQAMVHPSEQGLSPAAFGDMLQAGHQKAAKLQEIVEQAHLYININGKRYLTVEAWQTIGRAYGYTAKAGDVQIIRDMDGKELGIMARSIIYDANGQIVGGAEGYCMNDETTWANRPFYAKAGMAQTRSISRGFRQLVSWVVVLAGYAPTPAEEMMQDDKPMAKPTENEYGICPAHNVTYFKTGKMRSPAHRNADGSWCNKPAENKSTRTAGDARLDPINQESRKALRDIGYASADEILGILGTESVTAWLVGQKDKNLNDVIELLQEAKAAEVEA